MIQPLKHKIEVQILEDHLNYIEELKKQNPDCKIIDFYFEPLLYDIKRLPKRYVVEYLKGNKTSILTLIFIYETHYQLTRVNLLKNDQLKRNLDTSIPYYLSNPKEWINFLEKVDLIKEIFDEEVDVTSNLEVNNDGEIKNVETKKIKISEIQSPSIKLNHILSFFRIIKKVDKDDPNLLEIIVPYQSKYYICGDNMNEWDMENIEKLNTTSTNEFQYD